jgi:hypothetical protein
VNKVPEHLSLLPHIKKLTLHFTNEVSLPDWFYNLQIDNLTIKGKISDKLEDAIWERFPKALINSKGAASMNFRMSQHVPQSRN